MIANEHSIHVYVYIYRQAEFDALKSRKNGGCIHYLETVLVSSCTTACTALYYAFDNCYYSAVVSQSQTNTVYSYRHADF
jgi:hypothetical protein